MKRQTTRQGASPTRELLEKAWLNCWNNKLSMKRIRSWIEQIPQHIQEVIRLKEGNKYQEGRFDDTSSICLYDSEAWKKQYQRQKADIRPGDQDKEEVNKEKKSEESENVNTKDEKNDNEDEENREIEEEMREREEKEGEVQGEEE